MFNRWSLKRLVLEDSNSEAQNDINLRRHMSGDQKQGGESNASGPSNSHISVNNTFMGEIKRAGQSRGISFRTCFYQIRLLILWSIISEIELMMWSELETCHHKWYLDIENCFLLHSLNYSSWSSIFRVSSKHQKHLIQFILFFEFAISIDKFQWSYRFVPTILLLSL